jgi:epoxyqueuosine reductase
LGFDECRFAAAVAPAHAPEFRRWLAERFHGEMNYLERNADERVDPQKVLPGARSIIVLAATYAQGGQGSKAEGRGPDVASVPGESSPARDGDRNLRPPTSDFRPQATGIIARYARYRDYHLVLGDRLATLSQFVDSQVPGQSRSRWYVDTGPVLERDAAQRAGLGFIGKHTNLISRRQGNWIFLGEILTAVEFEPDAAELNRCGSCARCIAACPTEAIRAPFLLDARLCISYLTIESKGPIPERLRPAIGNRIYGCDDCLAVCPWNRFAREGQLMKEHARSDLGEPDLVELLALDEAGFRRRFEGTPLLRAKRRGFLRNVAVALGNVGDASAMPALRQAARDPEPLVAEHARWAIDRIEERCSPKKEENGGH